MTFLGKNVVIILKKNSPNLTELAYTGVASLDATYELKLKSTKNMTSLNAYSSVIAVGLNPLLSLL